MEKLLLTKAALCHKFILFVFNDFEFILYRLLYQFERICLFLSKKIDTNDHHTTS